MQKPKILMVNLGFIPESVGGSEFYTHNLSKSLIQNGYEVAVLTALDDVSIRRYEVTKTVFEGMKVIKIANSPFYVRSFCEYFIDPNVDNLFRDIIIEEEPDLIHFQHVAYLSGNLVEIAHQMNVPSVLTIHDYWYICFRTRLLRPDCDICSGPSGGEHCATCTDDSAFNPMLVSRSPLFIKFISIPLVSKLMINLMDKIPQPLISQARSVLFKASKQDGNTQSTSASLLAENKFRYEFFKRQLQYPKFVLSPSFHLKKRYQDEGYRETLVLPLGYHQANKVETPTFNGKLKIAFIGNIERHKGVAVMLKELLDLQLEKIQINIHGRAKDPTYFSEVKRFARQYPKGVVKFHGGYRSDQDLPAILSQNHLVVFPSIWEENGPLVVREALLHGLPVIGSNLGGVPEVIKDGVNGYLFDPFKPGDLLEKIKHVLRTPKVLENIAVGARNTKIEHMEEHVAKISNIYEQAIMST
jgi:glycosyltransferase involved in cell wall biosynthesis